VVPGSEAFPSETTWDHVKTKEQSMPKMKTKSGAAKRFKIRSGGSIKRGQAFKRHILTKKTTKNKRQLRGTEGIHDSDKASIRAMMPYA
jgi:large subunit ribosomal protein L35